MDLAELFFFLLAQKSPLANATNFLQLQRCSKASFKRLSRCFVPTGGYDKNTGELKKTAAPKKHVFVQRCKWIKRGQEIQLLGLYVTRYGSNHLKITGFPTMLGKCCLVIYEVAKPAMDYLVILSGCM